MRYVTVLLLAGCAGPWIYDADSEQRFHSDGFYCEQAASSQVNLGDRQQLFERCMYAKGWRRKW